MGRGVLKVVWKNLGKSGEAKLFPKLDFGFKFRSKANAELVH